jgi:hypothetical protein
VIVTADVSAQAAATLRIEAKKPNLTAVFKSLSDNGALGTEGHVLHSCTLAEGAAAALALQFRLVEPRGAAARCTEAGWEVLRLLGSCPPN